MRSTIYPLLMAGLTLTPVVVRAQSSAPVDISELGSYVGFGNTPGGNHVWVGGTSGVSPSKYFMAVLDVNFTPLGDATLRTNLVGPRTTSRLYDFNFGGHIQIPIHQRFTPYVLLSAGVLYNTYSITTVHPDGLVRLVGSSDCKFGFSTGAGLRYFVREDFGIRTEYRFTASTQNFQRALVGVFYQFGGPWPFLPHGRKRTTTPER
jgi:opacity protein-like surface antigen